MDSEKQTVTDEVREVPSSSTSSDAAESTWEPGFWKNFPWLGFAAICTILICMLSSILVLVVSNGKSQRHWHPRKVTPSVWLSGFNNVSNICFGIAIANGCAIAWWRRLLKGATIQDLHRSWAFSTSVKEAALAGKYINIIAITALTAKLTIIDGMLMQKATSTTIMADKPVNLTENIFPYGYVNDSIPVTGAKALGAEGKATALTTNFNDALKFWSNSGPLLSYGFGGCDGYCFLDIPAAGFEFDCTEEASQPINYGQTLMNTQSQASNPLRPANASLGPSQETAFSVSFTPVDASTDPEFRNQSAPYSYIQANFVYTRANDTDLYCPGTKYTRSCKLRPAVVSYPVMLQTFSDNSTTNGTRVGITESNYLENGLTFLFPGSYDSTLKQIEGYKVLRYKDLYEDANNNGSTQLGGIVTGLQMYLGGSADLELDDSAQTWTLKQQNNAPQYLNNSVDIGKCGYQYADPFSGFPEWNIPGVLERINEIMFTLAADLTEDSFISLDDSQLDDALEQSYNSTQYAQSVHYQSNYAYMAGALASTFFCVLCVLPSFWGFWQLGRKLALSPLEIAAAFRSPLVDSGKDINGIIADTGEKRVQFGHIVAGDAAGRLGVAEPTYVQRAHPGIATYKQEIFAPKGE